MRSRGSQQAVNTYGHIFPIGPWGQEQGVRITPVFFFFSFSLEYSRLSFALRINKKRKPPKQMIQVERRQPRLWNRVTSESITVLMCHSQTALWPQFLHLYWRCWFLGYKTTVRSWCHVFSSDWPMSLWKKHWHHTWKFSVVLLATPLDYLLSFTRY